MCNLTVAVWKASAQYLHLRFVNTQQLCSFFQFFFFLSFPSCLCRMERRGENPSTMATPLSCQNMELNQSLVSFKSPKNLQNSFFSLIYHQERRMVGCRLGVNPKSLTFARGGGEAKKGCVNMLLFERKQHLHVSVVVMLLFLLQMHQNQDLGTRLILPLALSPASLLFSTSAAFLQKQTNFFFSCRERQIKCPKCDKLFLRTNHLKKHLNSHEGKRDYVCEKCTKAYLTKYHLTRHLKICKGPTSSLSAPEEEEEDSEEELIDSLRTEDCRINNGVYSTGDALTGHK